MQCYAILCSTMQYYAVLCSAMQYLQYYAVLCGIMQCYMQLYAVLCSTMQYYAVSYCRCERCLTLTLSLPETVHEFMQVYGAVNPVFSK